jgi:hypothetical protein
MVVALSAVMLAAGALTAVLVPATAPAASQTARVASGAVNLHFNVRRFTFDRAHKRLVGHGNVIATYRSNGRVEGTTTQATTFTVKQAATSCQVLHLELGELHLVLLGLYVNLTPVNAPSIVLNISANSNEALGHLFCEVLNAVSGTSTSTAATTTTGAAKATRAARRLSSAFTAKLGGGVFSTSIPLSSRSSSATTTAATTTTTTTTATTGQCPVLDLVLGPLNLDLLGLVVQLNQIDLNISADPTGTLGTLFCGLAGTTSTSATTTAATTT